jgi:hypothetical protein
MAAAAAACVATVGAGPDRDGDAVELCLSPCEGGGSRCEPTDADRFVQQHRALLAADAAWRPRVRLPLGAGIALAAVIALAVVVPVLVLTAMSLRRQIHNKAYKRAFWWLLLWLAATLVARRVLLQ